MSETTSGELVRRRRIERQMTQEELGRKCGYGPVVAQVYVAQWETGRKPIPPTQYKKLSEILGIPLKDLMPHWMIRRHKGRLP